MNKLLLSKYFTVFLIILSILFMLIGILFFDEAHIVWNKAVRICMECIGIG